MPRRDLPDIQKRRLTPLILAQFSITIFGDNDILPILGIDHYPFTHLQIYPFGSMAAVFYGIIIGYSVLQYQLLDFQIVMGRIAARLVRISFLGLVGLGVMLCLTLIAPDQFTYFSILGGLLAVLVGAITAASLFPRLFGDSGEDLERRILGDRFEYHDQIREFIANMQWYTEADVMLDEFNDLLTKTIRIQSYQIILRDESARAFKVLRAYPADELEMPELTSNSPIFRFFEVTGAEYPRLQQHVRDAQGDRNREEGAGVPPAFREHLLPAADDLGRNVRGSAHGAESGERPLHGHRYRPHGLPGAPAEPHHQPDPAQKPGAPGAGDRGCWAACRGAWPTT